MPGRSVRSTGKILNADGVARGRDGDNAYGLTAQYDLGGGASVNSGVAPDLRRRSASATTDDDDSASVGDFGISMAF